MSGLPIPISKATSVPNTNRNHLAGLIEMVLLITLALFSYSN